MVQAEASIDRGMDILHLVWMHRGRILVSTLALGLAAFLAGSLVPAVHRVSLRLSGDPSLVARWTDARVRDVAGQAPPIGDGEPAGVLAVWNDLIETAAPAPLETGADRMPDGSLLIWAEAHDAGLARRRAEAIAATFVGEPALAQSQASGDAPAEEAVDPPIAALKTSVAEAREALTAAEDERARVQAAEPSGSGSRDAERRSSLDADRQAAAAAKQELGGIERFARGLPGAAPSQAPPSVRATEEWTIWRDAQARRDLLARQVAEASRTLLDGHPRMATLRLRLSDLEQDLAEARQQLGDALQRRARTLRRDADRLDRRVAETMVALGATDAAVAAAAEAASDVDAARGTLAALEEALASAEAALAAAPAPEPVVSTPAPPVVTEISATKHRPTIWPIVAGAALFGFLGSSLVTLAGAARRHPAGEPALVPVARRVFARRPASADPSQRQAESSTVGITAPDELIGGILASDISRLVVVSLGPDDRPAAVEIVRRLALRGRQGALADLSAGQLAARGMGVSPDALGISDMIAGEATFAEIAKSDFATRAEAFGSGRATVGEAAFLAMERRNVLEFIERNYELLIVVCGDMDPETVKTLLTPDAALVLTVEGAEDERIAAGVRRLREAGLADMILVDGRQFAS